MEEKKTLHSGRLLLRMGKALHTELAEEAKKYGMSLNSYLVYLLSKRKEEEKAKRELLPTRISLIRSKKVKLTLLSYFFPEISFRVLKEAPPSPPEIKVESSIRPDEKDESLWRVSVNLESEEKSPYEIRITIEGTFRVQEKDATENDILKEATSLLLPILQSLILTITSQAPHGPILIGKMRV